MCLLVLRDLSESLNLIAVIIESVLTINKSSRMKHFLVLSQ